MSALDKCHSIGDLHGCCDLANQIGSILSACGDHQGSLKSYLQCLEIRKFLGLPPIGHTLEGMGIAWAKLGKTADARQAFEEALKQYGSESTASTQDRITCSQFFLCRLEDSSLVPKSDEVAALRRCYSDNHVNKILAPL